MQFSDDLKDRISAHDFVVVDKNIYFFSMDFNGLYCLHMPQREVEFLGSVPGEEFRQRHLYGPIIEIDGKLYMPPLRGKGIVIYDISRKQFEKIALKYGDMEMNSKFFKVLCDDKKIFFIPCRYHYLVVLDITNNQVMYLDEWYHLLNMPEQHNEILVRNGAFIRNNVLYMASFFDNTLIEISTKNYKTKAIKIGENKDGFVDMCLDETHEYIWFLKKNTATIFKWNMETLKNEIFEIKSSCFQQIGRYPFINVICAKDKIYLVAYQCNTSFMLDKNENKFIPMEWEKNITPVRTEWDAKHYFAKKIEKDVFIVANVEDYSFYLIQNSKIVEKFYLCDSMLYYRFLCHGRKIVRENDNFTLKQYQKVMLNFSIESNANSNGALTCGQKIYDMMKTKV